ncbi:B3 DNA binding domain containing protein [Klebsormidium nitens]|uniref:B3 DNA binding domain containing protein n=1 Tax=Klebsormidium nitens TaxID=105231 RepID=A0A1Y1HZD7_KLENI|nr:B3 DNA binding domain containing protein [Klebsormidium nitens]|eukprot:GAQ81897.1 B3 DNA binding domain containing protein [Klebsormidium nitens]
MFDSEGAAGIVPPREKPEPNGNGPMDQRERPKAAPPKGVVRSTFGMQIVNCVGAAYPKIEALPEETMLHLGQEKKTEALPGSSIRASLDAWRGRSTSARPGLEEEGKKGKAVPPLSWNMGGKPAEGEWERGAESAKPVSIALDSLSSHPAPFPEASGKCKMILKSGKFEIDEYRNTDGSGRIRTLEVQHLKGKDAVAEPENEPSSSAAGPQEDPGFENEARAILKVEHLLANQSPGLLTSDQQAGEGSGRWSQEGGERGLEQGLERGFERGESLSRQEDGVGFALFREDSLKLFSSQYRGVVAQPHGKWGAQIYDKHVRLWLGTYDAEIDAARAHDRAAVKIKGNDAMTNFRPLTVADPEGAFIAGVGRDQHVLAQAEELVEMLRKHTFDEEMANSARLGQLAARLESFQQPSLDGAQKRQFLFEKALTPSDVGKLNRLVFPKHYAERFFPLDLDQVSVGQTLQFEDERGKFWRFRYSYWNSSQSYVLTKGWSRFVKEKGLLPGDNVVFEKGHTGQLYIGYARTQSGEGGPALPSPVPFGASPTQSSAYEEKPCLPQRAWLHGSAPLGGSPGPPSSAPRLFGVTLTPSLGDSVPRQLLRTGSLPVKASLSPKRRFAAAFDGAPVNEGTARQLASVRRVLSEGQTRLGGLLGGEDAEARQPDERRLWGETLRNGFLEVGKRLEGQSAPGVLTPKVEEDVRPDGDGDGGVEGPGLGLRIGPPESEEEQRPQVKCFVEESPYGVVVDLSQYKSTQQLKNALLDATHGRLVVYQDKDGDMILLGDEEWSFFLKTVSRIFIRK